MRPPAAGPSTKLALGLLLAGCGDARTPQAQPRFVRGGLLVPRETAAEGTPLPDGWSFVPQTWIPGDAVSWRGTSLQAPLRAECVPVTHVDLGDAASLIARGGEPPDTALAWSPDGATLAIGTWTGEVKVLGVSSGTRVRSRSFPEAVVKEVAWSPDGRALYAAEQSPDALLHALDPVTLADRWTLRLADRVGSSAWPPGDDLYGAYTLPGAYGLEVLPDGDLVVAAVHAWNDAEGVRHNLSQVLRLTPEGTVAAAWPPTPRDVTLMHPAVDAPGGLVAVPVGRSADGPDPPDLPVDGIQVLSLPDLIPQGSFVAQPLVPWFPRAFAWQAVDVRRVDDGWRILVGLGDGRVFLTSSTGDVTEVPLGVPILAGEVPIAASVGFGLLREDEAVVETARTNIPYGTRSAATRPPEAHPAENALWSHGPDGSLRWTWSGPHALSGLTLGPDGTTLVAGAGPRVTDDRLDLFGALVFDLSRPGSGRDRLAALCPTDAPVFFRHAISRSGAIAVTTFPFEDATGRLRGAWQVVVFR